MSVEASCPQCSATSSVPNEMLGKKVRCKRCRTKFIVEESVDDVPLLNRTAGLARSGGMRRPKTSNATIWLVLSVVTLILIGVGGVGLWVAMQEEPVKQAKAKPTRREDAAKEDIAAEKKSAKAKAFLASDGQAARSGRKAQPFSPNATPTGEVKLIEPSVVAALAAWTPLEIKDLTDIKEILPLANQSLKVGLHTTEGGQHYFEMYDLKKQERVAKVKLANNVEQIDVDPDGTMLATGTNENHFDIYSLPDGGYVADDWRPYDTPKDPERFLRGGKVAQIAALAKGFVWAITSPGHGDLWELPSQKFAYKCPMPARDDFLKAEVRADRDFVLSPDRALFAFATDDGIEFFDVKTKQKLGSSPKLTRYGTKLEMIGMGFEPGKTKLAVYFSAIKGEGRRHFLARFRVPSGDELMLEAGPAPAEYGGVEFVNGDYFLSFDRNQAILRDDKGKTVATCNVPGRGSRFAQKVVQGNVAFAFTNEKNKPALGIVRIPAAGVAAPAPVVSVKGKSLSEILADNPPPPALAKPRTFDRQEIWEFGSQGIVRTGIKSFER